MHSLGPFLGLLTLEGVGSLLGRKSYSAPEGLGTPLLRSMGVSAPTSAGYGCPTFGQASAAASANFLEPFQFSPRPPGVEAESLLTTADFHLILEIGFMIRTWRLRLVVLLERPAMDSRG